jgi:hypothetical protein
VWPEREDAAIDTAGPIMLALGAIGILLGALTRSWWALLYPTIPTIVVLLALVALATSNAAARFDYLDVLTAVLLVYLVYIVPGVIGTELGVVGR